MSGKCSYLGRECIYCGMPAESLDHIPPLCTYSDNKQNPRRRKNVCVPACKECNCTLSCHHLMTISERAEYLADRYSIKYRKILNIPVWSEEEIQSLGNSLSNYMRARNRQRESIVMRIGMCNMVARLRSLTPEDYWDKSDFFSYLHGGSWRR